MVGEDTTEEKMELTVGKNKKSKLQMDPIIEALYQSKEHSALVNEPRLLVAKSPRMLKTP